jgi:hypothetical protein
MPLSKGSSAAPPSEVVDENGKVIQQVKDGSNAVYKIGANGNLIYIGFDNQGGTTNLGVGTNGG